MPQVVHADRGLFTCRLDAGAASCFLLFYVQDLRRPPGRGLEAELSAYQEAEPCVLGRRVGSGRLGGDGIERRLQAGVFDVQRTGDSADRYERLGDDLLDVICFCGAHRGPPPGLTGAVIDWPPRILGQARMACSSPGSVHDQGQTAASQDSSQHPGEPGV
jgi:hypothetical protein